MPATPYRDLLVVATATDAFVRARARLWSINATALASLALTEPRPEELMRHLPLPPAFPLALAHRYSAQAWDHCGEGVTRLLIEPASGLGWSALVEEVAEGPFTGPTRLLRHLAPGRAG